MKRYKLVDQNWRTRAGEPNETLNARERRDLQLLNGRLRACQDANATLRKRHAGDTAVLCACLVAVAIAAWLAYFGVGL